jgi:hypothetical protein
VLGQVWVTSIPGLVSSGQVLLALADTRVPAQVSAPLAVTVEVIEQPLFTGTV